MPCLVPVRRPPLRLDLAPRTTSTYLEGVTQLAQFLDGHGIPYEPVRHPTREHIEALARVSQRALSRSVAPAAGILWRAVSPTAAFAYLAVWMVIALVALVGMRSRSGRT